MLVTERVIAALASRYSIEREIGSGGMATVYLAHDLKHDRKVAVKVLHPDLSAVVVTERFLAEVSIAAKLEHPHILTLIDSGSAEGILYYVIPYVRGESLRAKLKREKQLGVDEAVSITKQVASALDYAHAQGLVHRDIKPENILLHEGEAMLADFGIALAVKQGGGSRLTETGISLGTPAYMSPEQATGERTLDRRSDVYSLGAVSYEMIAGEPPLTGATPQALVAKLLTERPVRLRVLRGTIPGHVERAVEKALAKVPADRFKTAGEFADALETATPVRSWWRSGTMLTRSLAAAGLIGIVAGGAWLARGTLTGARESHAVLSDRRLITNTGHVSFPAISPDGKTLAYLLMQCRTQGCTYGIELQDIDGSESHQIFDGVSELTRGGLEWSPDRRNILAYGRIREKQGTFLISTLGGAARRVGPGVFAFWAGGDSLLSFGSTSPSGFWILVSGLDGVTRDSIAINAPADAIASIVPIPGSPWIAVGLVHGPRIQWVSIDRTGRIAGSAPPRSGPGYTARASADAFWVSARSPGSNLRSVVRIPFDGRTGQFGSREDTIYTGSSTSIGVTADGGSFVFDEGTTEYTLWALDLRDAIRGVLSEKRRLLTATSALANELSPDGRKILIGRVSGSTSEGIRWEVLPFTGGPATAITGTPESDFWADSVTVTLRTETSRGTELALLDVNTGARRAAFVVPDSAIGNFVSLPDGGWAWVVKGGIRVHRQGEAVRTLSIAKWYAGVETMTAYPDGKRLLIMGRRSLNADSVRLSVMSLSDGVATTLKTAFGGAVWPELLADGSIILAVWDTPDWVTIHHILESGQTEWTAAIPRPVWSFSASADMRRAALTVRDYHGDAFLSRVVRR